MRWTLFVLLVALAPATAAQGAPDARSRDFDQLHLDIRITPDLERGVVEGRVTHSFESLRPGLGRIELHCEDTRILAVVGENADPLAWTNAKGVLAIDLAAQLDEGQGSSVTVVYRSTPRRGLYFHRPTKRYPRTPLFMYSQGQSNDNRRWIPCYDLPDDRFLWDLRVTVQDELETVSNGMLVDSEETGDDLRTDHWQFDDRAPSYLIGLIVGDLQTVTDTWRDRTLHYTAIHGHEEELRTALGGTPAMLEIFSTYLDAPYPWPRYAQTFVWDFVYGGMENVTATTLNMRALHGPRAAPNYSSEGLVAHELAHMWFGDLITCRTWHDIWLNEGFATYLTDIYWEHHHGRDEFLLRRQRQNRGYMDGTHNPENLGLKRDPRGDRPLELFGGKQYNRGAAILHMLRLELGDEVFQKAIQAYVARFRDQAVGSEDLLRVAEEIAGRDLRWFFDQWVYGAGYPVLDVQWMGRSVTVRQTQGRKGGQGLFRLTLPVRLDATGPVHELRIWKEWHQFTLPGPSQKQENYLRVGVGGDLLARIRFSQSQQSWEEQLRRDPDVTGRLDAVVALEPWGAATVPALSNALFSDTSWAVREIAAEVLGRMAEVPQAVAALASGASDSDPRVREAACKSLGSGHRDAVSPVLLRAASEETHDYPRAAAAESLGRVKAAGAYDVLASLLGVDSHGDIVRQGVMRGLAALGDPRGAAVAATYCDYAWGRGGAQKLRKAALDCVTRIAPDARETHALLTGLLDDPHHAMRSWAAEACGTYTVHGARRKLESLAKSDWNGGVQAAAKAGLKRLDQDK